MVFGTILFLLLIFFFSLFLRYTFDYKIRKSEINENNNFRLKHAFALYGKLFLRTRKTNIYFSMSHVRASETGRDWAREGEREGAICGDIKYKFLLSCFYRGGFYFYFFFWPSGKLTEPNWKLPGYFNFSKRKQNRNSKPKGNAQKRRRKRETKEMMRKRRARENEEGAAKKEPTVTVKTA